MKKTKIMILVLMIFLKLSPMTVYSQSNEQQLSSKASITIIKKSNGPDSYENNAEQPDNQPSDTTEDESSNVDIQPSTNNRHGEQTKLPQTGEKKSNLIVIGLIVIIISLVMLNRYKTNKSLFINKNK